MKRSFLLLAAALFFLYQPGIALAHSVYIFAWVDGAQVCTESYFTQSSKVRGGEVVMSSITGEILAKGVTNEGGLLCFPLPDKVQSLEFTVLAGAGHRGTFKLEEKDLAGAVNAQKEEAGQQQVSSVGKEPTVAPAPLNTQMQLPPGAGTENLIRRIVQEELQKQLSPMRQYLAEKLENNTPGIKEIIGGIGWLLGLGALGFWYSQRGKKQ